MVSRSSWSHPPYASLPTWVQNVHLLKASPQPQGRSSTQPRNHSSRTSPAETKPSISPSIMSSSVLPHRPHPPTTSTRVRVPSCLVIAPPSVVSTEAKATDPIAGEPTCCITRIPADDLGNNCHPVGNFRWND